MSILDIDYFKTILAEREIELRKLLEQSAEGACVVDLDQSCVGRLSRMDAMLAQAMSLETRRRAELDLRKILAAQKRLELGDYGECQQCGQQIIAGRLKIDPAAQYCLLCASRKENTNQTSSPCL